jgi:hypothetical protein
MDRIRQRYMFHLDNIRRKKTSQSRIYVMVYVMIANIESIGAEKIMLVTSDFLNSVKDSGSVLGISISH